jgi:hypothetical protein
VKPNVVFFVRVFYSLHSLHTDHIRGRPSHHMSATNRAFCSRLFPFPSHFHSCQKPKLTASRLELVANASRILVIGTSLATYSCFRLIKAAVEKDKPVLMISTGPSRADGLKGVEKMDRIAGPVLRALLDEMLKWVPHFWVCLGALVRESRGG